LSITSFATTTRLKPDRPTSVSWARAIQKKKAKEPIAAAVIAETYYIMEAKEPFNLKRFTGMHEALPELP